MEFSEPLIGAPGIWVSRQGQPLECSLYVRLVGIRWYTERYETLWSRRMAVLGKVNVRAGIVGVIVPPTARPPTRPSCRFELLPVQDKSPLHVISPVATLSGVLVVRISVHVQTRLCPFDDSVTSDRVVSIIVIITVVPMTLVDEFDSRCGIAVGSLLAPLDSVLFGAECFRH